MIARIKGYILAAAVVVAIVIGAFFSGKVNGRAAHEAETRKQEADALRKARKIEQEANAMPIDDVRKRIASRLRD